MRNSYAGPTPPSSHAPWRFPSVAFSAKRSHQKAQQRTAGPLCRIRELPTCPHRKFPNPNLTAGAIFSRRRGLSSRTAFLWGRPSALSLKPQPHGLLKLSQWKISCLSCLLKWPGILSWQQDSPFSSLRTCWPRLSKVAMLPYPFLRSTVSVRHCSRRPFHRRIRGLSLCLRTRSPVSSL